MRLPFSIQLNRKPTYFVDRIWQSILFQNGIGGEVCHNYIKEHYSN